VSRQCDALARYLVGRRCPPDVAERYLAAVDRLPQNPSPFEEQLWRAALRVPPLLACLDAGVSLCDRSGSIRTRLLVMFALLEACPETADRFLFAGVTRLDLARTLVRALLAPFALVLGLPIGLACRAASRRTGS
jgi:hypothetical protein